MGEAGKTSQTKTITRMVSTETEMTVTLPVVFEAESDGLKLTVPTHSIVVHTELMLTIP